MTGALGSVWVRVPGGSAVDAGAVGPVAAGRVLPGIIILAKLAARHQDTAEREGAQRIAPLQRAVSVCSAEIDFNRSLDRHGFIFGKYGLLRAFARQIQEKYLRGMLFVA